MEPLKCALQDWVTRRGLSRSWKLGDNVESNVPAFAPTPSGCTHVSPGRCLFWLPPTPASTQKTAPMDPKAKCPHALSSSSPRSRRGTGLWFGGHCSHERAQNGSTSRGYKKLQPLCTMQEDATCLLPGGRGTFQTVFSSWRAGRGGASYKLLQIIAVSWQLILPPTHKHGAQCCC